METPTAFVVVFEAGSSSTIEAVCATLDGAKTLVAERFNGSTPAFTEQPGGVLFASHPRFAGFSITAFPLLP